MKDCLFTIVQFWKDGAVVRQEELETPVPYYYWERRRCRGICMTSSHVYDRPDWMTIPDWCVHYGCEVDVIEVYVSQMYVRQVGNTVHFETQYHYLYDR